MNMLKMIISILTSLQLMVLQIAVPIAVTQSLFASSNAYAETTSVDQEATNTSDPTSVGAGQEGEMTKVFKGLEPESAGDMLNFVMMIIIGILAAGLMKCEKKSADIYIAAIGGLIYIAGEVMQFFKSEAKFEQEAIEYETTETGAPDLDESQEEAFRTQKEGYLEARDAAKNKAMMQKAAAAAFGVAAATAYTAAAMFKGGAIKCMAEAKAYIAAPLPDPATKTACTTTIGKILEYQGTEAAPKYSATDFASCTATVALSKSCAVAPDCVALEGFAYNACASCQTFYSPIVNAPLEKQLEYSVQNYQMYANAPQCKMPQEQLVTSNLFYNVIEKSLDLLFPKAKAKMSPMMTLFGGLGVGIGVVLLLKDSMKPVMEFMIGTPVKRGIMYTLLAGTAWMVSKKSDDVADQMQENANKIDGILNRFKNMESTAQMINNAFNKQQSLTSVPLNAGARLATEGEAFPCLTTTTKDAKCVSAKSLVDGAVGQSNLDLPDGTATVVDTAATTADALAGQSALTQAAVDGVNSLSSQAKKMDALNRKLEKKLNDLDKMAGKKATDYNKARNNLLGKLQGSMLKAMNKKGLDGYQTLAAVSPVSAPAVAPSNVKDDIKKAVAKQSAEATSTGKTAKSSGSGFNFKFDEPKGDTLKFDEPKDQGLAGLAEGELEVDDIVQDPSVSIFKVISVRYLKSGYPRVLELKEQPADEPKK